MHPLVVGIILGGIIVPCLILIGLMLYLVLAKGE